MGGVGVKIGRDAVRTEGKRGCGRFLFFLLPDTHNPHPPDTVAPSLPLTAPRQPTPPTPQPDPENAENHPKRAEKGVQLA